MSGEWSAKKYQSRPKNIRAPSVSEGDCDPSLTLRALTTTAHSFKCHVTCQKEHGQPFRGRPCSTHGRNKTSIGARHNDWLRTLFPARRAGLAKASGIE